IDLSQLIDEVVRLTRRTFDRAIEIEAEFVADLTVLGDRSQLHQVLMNLCINARDAMPRGGTLYIKAGLAPPKDLPLALQVANSGPFVLLSVPHTGAGMDEDTQ